MAKQLTEKQMRAKFLQTLEANGGEATAAEMVEGTGFPKATVNEIAKALVKEKIVLPAPGGKIALPEEPEEEAPAPAPKKAAKKVAPPVAEEEPEDDDSNDLGDGEDDGFGLDDDEGLDADGDEGFEDDEEPAPAKKGAKAAKTKAVTLAPAHAEFSMPFKPIDTLDDEELTDRIDNATAAAESLMEQGHELVAEMLMRSVAKARRQLNKRQA